MSLLATETLIGTLPPEKIRGLQKGTVEADFESVTDLRVTIDGDSSPSHVMSMVGELQAGQRVMVLFTEPHGAYVAWLLEPPAWRNLALGASWHQLAPAAGVTPETAQVRRVGDVAEFRGMVYVTGAPPARIATIPAGFLTTREQSFPGDSGGAYCSLVVGVTSGGLDTALCYNGGGTPTGYVSIASVRYSVTAP